MLQICCSSSTYHYCVASLFSVPNAGNREWMPAPYVRQSGATITLSISKCLKNMFVVGLRYAWHERPCQLEQCPVYGKDLPMSPYIRQGLIDNGEWQELQLARHDLF